MSESDERLERNLQALEGGVPLKRILAEENSSNEIASLVSLAATIRDLPHPEQDDQAVQSQKRVIVTAAREKQLHNGKTQARLFGGFTGQWMLLPAFGGLALILLMVFILAAGAGIYFMGPRGAHTATLTDAAGRVQVSSSDVSDDWYLVSNGNLVRSGQRIRTGKDSWVTLVFFDGTRTTLTPDTELVMTKIDGSWGNVLQVALNQSAGQTENRVVPLRGESSEFNVMTPSGSAYVRGTAFDVQVDENGRSMFKVDTGKVLVTNDGAETYVEAGQGLTTQIGKPLESPNYLFVLQGEVNSIEGETWTVAGVSLTVPGGTQAFGDTSVGENVLIEGEIAGNNRWVVDSVYQALTDDQLGTFTGVVNPSEGNNWQVNGIDFGVDDLGGRETEIDAGDVVRITFQVSDGSALKVSSIDSLEDESSGTEPALAPDPKAHPRLAFEPDEIGETGCREEYTIAGVLANEAKKPYDLAVNVALGYEIIKGKEYVESVSFDPPIGWEQIQPGESETFNVNLTINFDAWMTAPSGTEVKVRVYVAEETNWPGHHGSLTVTVKSDCDTGSGDGDEDDDETVDEPEDTCTGTDQHPKALKLLNYYNQYPEFAALEYGTIMGWFCNDHLGFGEIDHMLGLAVKYSQQTDSATAEEILGIIHDLRVQDGLGWGQIKQELANDYGSPQEKGRPFKPEPPGKKKAEENKNKNKPGKKGDD